MKRFFCLLFTFLFIVSLCGCTDSYAQADEYAKKYITALLIRDENEMRKYTHPDYSDQAIPDDKFYETLEQQFLTLGHPLTNLSGVGKSEIEEIDDAIRCTYVARVNELFYTVELIIVDNDNGYGIVSVAMVLNTELDYYYQG